MHVAKIFAGAERRGLVVIEGPGGSAIRPTPLLIEKFLEWMATQFLFFADCAGEAMAKRAAARRAKAPGNSRRAIFRRHNNVSHRREKGQRIADLNRSINFLSIAISDIYMGNFMR